VSGKRALAKQLPGQNLLEKISSPRKDFSLKLSKRRSLAASSVSGHPPPTYLPKIFSTGLLKSLWKRRLEITVTLNTQTAFNRLHHSDATYLASTASFQVRSEKSSLLLNVRRIVSVRAGKFGSRVARHPPGSAGSGFPC
jgi:hypothetical protein